MRTTGRLKSSISTGISTESDRERRSKSGRLLYRTVLLQAARDIASDEPARQLEVQRWMLSPDFHAVCRAAELDAMEAGRMLLSLHSIDQQRRPWILQQIQSVLQG